MTPLRKMRAKRRNSPTTMADSIRSVTDLNLAERWVTKSLEPSCLATDCSMEALRCSETNLATKHWTPNCLEMTKAKE
jgi:hypothetical protein